MDRFSSPILSKKGFRSAEVAKEELFIPPPPSSPPEDDDNSGASDDDLDFTDADAAIDAMLDDLQLFQKELGSPEQDSPRLSLSRKHCPPKVLDEELDHLRISLENIDETPDVDLDALLEDLCSMEKDMNPGSSTLDRNRNASSGPYSSSNLAQDPLIFQFTPATPIRGKPMAPVRVTYDVKERLENLENEMQTKELTPEEKEAKIKAEKMKIALEKMKAASFQKMFVKVYEDDLEVSKMIMIDQLWTAREVVSKMIRKGEMEIGPNWCVVERLPELHMERILEDHEYVLRTVLDWPRETQNMLVFSNRREKYLLFKNPQNFLLSGGHTDEDTKLAEKSKDILLNEFFQKDKTTIPDCEGLLWLREGKKNWNKHYFVLRASGVYYSPKGKQKTREVSNLVQFEHANVYVGLGFKRNFKAPTDHVICLKHPKVQTIQSKHIFCLCAEDRKTMNFWLNSIRVAKYGYSMYDDYLKTQEDVERMLLSPDDPSMPDESSANGTISSTSDANACGSTNVGRGAERAKNIDRGGFPDAQSQTSTARVKGKQAALAELFATAWSKGLEGREVGGPHPALPQSPDTVRRVAAPDKDQPRMNRVAEEPQDSPAKRGAQSPVHDLPPASRRHSDKVERTGHPPPLNVSAPPTDGLPSPPFTPPPSVLPGSPSQRMQSAPLPPPQSAKPVRSEAPSSPPPPLPPQSGKPLLGGKVPPPLTPKKAGIS